MDLIESQLRRDTPGKSAHPKLPPPPPKSPLPPPQPPQPPRPDHANPKRKREQKGKEVVDVGRSRPTHEDETQKAAKQQKTSQVPQKRVEREGNQPSESQAWLLAPKCVIKAKDPRLHRISIFYKGFAVPEDISIPEGTLLTQPLFMATTSIEASSSQLVIQEEDKEEEKEEEEE